MYRQRKLMFFVLFLYLPVGNSSAQNSCKEDKREIRLDFAFETGAIVPLMKTAQLCFKPNKPVIATYHYLASETGEACDTGKSNCDGDSYAWADYATTFPLLTSPIKHPGTQQIINKVTVGGSDYTQVTAADVDRYWDYYFQGFKKTQGADLSKNCHGYAFDEGRHPFDGSYGCLVIVKDGTCYEQCGVEDAEVCVLYGGSHSIKVKSKLCPQSASFSIIYKTSEKFRCSGIYEREGDCPNGISPGSIHLLRGLGDATPSLYKKRG